MCWLGEDMLAPWRVDTSKLLGPARIVQEHQRLIKIPFLHVPVYTRNSHLDTETLKRQESRTRLEVNICTTAILGASFGGAARN